VRAGEADAAVQTLRRAIQLRPDAASPHFNLGRALGQLGLEQEALASLRRAAELDPRYRSP
jgi:Flp pilus assembly protein TadD